MTRISRQEAKLAGNILNVDWGKINFDQFQTGMEKELEEHGSAQPKYNVTDDDLIKVGKIVLAHLEEKSDYYSNNNLDEDMMSGPAPMNLTTISEKTAEVIAQTLGFDLTKVQPEEFRLGIVEELDKMMVYTSAGINNEKLAKAATSSWENLQTHPTFYSAPPNQDFAHVLTGKQFSGDIQYEHLQKYLEHVINEDFASVVAGLKAAPANLWAKAKGQLAKSTALFKGLLNKSLAKLEAGKTKLDPFVNLIRQAEQESGQKLPSNKTLQIAQNLPNLAKEAQAEIEAQKSAVAGQQQQQPVAAATEAFVRETTVILNEGIRQASKPTRAINEALTPTVVLGFALALIGGIPMLIKALHKLAGKLKLEKTANVLKHAHHVAHSAEQKIIDYIIPDILSYKLYTKFWKAGIKVRGSKAFERPITMEEYKAGEGNVRETVESIVYKVMLVWFFAQGIRGAWTAGASMLGLAEGAASSVKAVEIAAVVTQIADIVGPDILGGESG